MMATITIPDSWQWVTTGEGEYPGWPWERDISYEPGGDESGDSKGELQLREFERIEEGET
jgi:hypothetical protein